MSNNSQEIQKRRIFGIISHPDAGKTTLTEKLLLHGGAIREAGTVKARGKNKFAKSDWMEIEKQRGISVTSSVMQFEYDGKVVSIMDTPGHNDFGEDTYRILTSVDSAVMVIDAAKGVETQTVKLFKVCSMREIPIFTFINKLDRQSKHLRQTGKQSIPVQTEKRCRRTGCQRCIRRRTGRCHLRCKSGYPARRNGTAGWRR